MYDYLHSKFLASFFLKIAFLNKLPITVQLGNELILKTVGRFDGNSKNF